MRRMSCISRVTGIKQNALVLEKNRSRASGAVTYILDKIVLPLDKNSYQTRKFEPAKVKLTGGRGLKKRLLPFKKVYPFLF